MKTGVIYQLTRDVDIEECPWLKQELKEGDQVKHFYGCTYGCVSQEGTACTVDNETFFELPNNSLNTIQED